MNRRELFKGAGAFVAAATTYETTSAGILMPTDKIIQEPTGATIIYDGHPVSMDISQQVDLDPICSLNFEGHSAIIQKSQTNLQLELNSRDFPANSRNKLLSTPRVRVTIFIPDY